MFKLGFSQYTGIPGVNSLSLFGAGARSIYQAGVLKRIYELKKEYTYIYAYSGGSLNAAMFAQGDIDLLEWLWLNIQNKDVKSFAWAHFWNSPWLYSMTPLWQTLKKHIDPEKVRKCHSQIFVSVTSLEKNASEQFDLKAMPDERLDDLDFFTLLVASASIPVLAPPLFGKYYDGGISNSSCVAEAAGLGVETITTVVPSLPAVVKVKTLEDAAATIASIPRWSDYLEQKFALSLMSEPKPKLVEIAPPCQMPGSLFDFSFKGMDRKQMIQQGYDLCKQVLG